MSIWSTQVWLAGDTAPFEVDGYLTGTRRAPTGSVDVARSDIGYVRLSVTEIDPCPCGCGCDCGGQVGLDRSQVEEIRDALTLWLNDYQTGSPE